MAMMNSVNRIFLRRSGTLKALTKARSTRTRFYPSGDELGRASGGFDLGLGGLGERVGLDGQGPSDVASGQHFHRPSAVDQAARQHGGGIDLTTLERLGQRLHIHHRVLDPVAVGEALQLGQATLERHLAALEPQLGVVAGAVPLGPPARRLALAGGPAPADAPLPLRGTGSGTEMMELHPFSCLPLFAERPLDVSSTFTRWLTLAIMPRISVRSSLTTESPRRCSPNRRTVAF